MKYQDLLKGIEKTRHLLALHKIKRLVRKAIRFPYNSKHHAATMARVVKELKKNHIPFDYLITASSEISKEP